MSCDGNFSIDYAPLSLLSASQNTWRSPEIGLILPHSKIIVIVVPEPAELAGRGLDVAGLDDVTLGLLVVVDVVDGLLGGLLVAGALVVTAEGLNSTLPLPLQRPGSTSSQSQGV